MLRGRAVRRPAEEDLLDRLMIHSRKRLDRRSYSLAEEEGEL